MTLPISGHTQSLALVASPCAQSFSPALHNTSFKLLNKDARYFALDVQGAALEPTVRGLAALGFTGYNVGVPNKSAILAYLDEITDAARVMGAVNTVLIKDGKSIGYNTDGLSFTDTLEQAGIPVKGLCCVIADADGEGSAYATQAAFSGARKVTLVAPVQHLAPLKELASKLEAETACAVDVLDLEDDSAFADRVAEAQVFCNATRIGTGDQQAQTPLPKAHLHKGLTVLDAIYDPKETRLLAEAQEAGCRTIGGLELLLNQAAQAELLWLDCAMPKQAIAKALF